MGRIEKTVFISYRRTNIPWALALYQHLTSQGYDVFFDYQSIKSGDFEQVIMQNVRGRAHFIVILTPSALKRCVEPNDWLRREIELALDEKRNIVPLFFEGFDFSSPSIAKYLTGKLALLKKYNGLNVPSDYFDAAMTKLRNERLDITLDTVLHPIKTSVQRKVQAQQIAASKAPEIKEKALNAQEWFEKGLNFDDNSDDEIYCYSQAILLQPDYADTYYNRGNVRYNQGDLVGAIVDYTEAIRIKPNDASAYYNRGVARDKQGDIASAIADYNEAVRIKPDYAKAYYNRGVARKAQGDLVGAITDYTEAIRIKPDYTDAYYNRGIARKAQNDWMGAIGDYQKYLDLGGGIKDGDQKEVEKIIQDLKKKVK